MDIIERREAIDRGLEKYFTGLKCKHGHIAQRYTVNGSCMDCQAGSQRKHRDGINKRIEAVKAGEKVG